MINYKLEKNLIGGKNWPRIPMVFVKGIPIESDVVAENTEDENEKVIQSWKNVVVLRATSEQPTEFYIGYYDGQEVAYLKHEFATDLDFAMRIGPKDVHFFVLPKDLSTDIKLEVLKQTTENDPKYQNLILV